MIIGDCDHCEQVMQPYLDRVLDDAERATAESHLSECAHCAKRYRWEIELRQVVRTQVAEIMSPDLKQKLAALRTPLL